MDNPNLQYGWLAIARVKTALIQSYRATCMYQLSSEIRVAAKLGEYRSAYGMASPLQISG